MNPVSSESAVLATVERPDGPLAAQSRADFESFMRWSRTGKGRIAADNLLNRMGKNEYASESTQRHWWTWQHARTALLANAFEPPDCLQRMSLIWPDADAEADRAFDERQEREQRQLERDERGGDGRGCCVGGPR